MRFWFRELVGWLLVALGLYLFLVVATELLNPAIDWPRFIQAGPFILIGFIIYRGGIHLLKVAVAARVCMLAQEEISRQMLEAPRRAVRAAPWEQ
jgi:hypothetical protein